MFCFVGVLCRFGFGMIWVCGGVSFVFALEHLWCLCCYGLLLTGRFAAEKRAMDAYFTAPLFFGYHIVLGCKIYIRAYTVMDTAPKSRGPWSPCFLVVHTDLGTQLQKVGNHGALVLVDVHSDKVGTWVQDD